MCDRVVSEGSFLIVYCPDRYKTQRMCDEAADDRLAAFKFIPDWFVTSKTLENFDNASHNNILFLMKILIKSHLLLIKDIFLLQIFKKLILILIIILMKMILNHFDNILRPFDVLPNFPFTTSETMRDYYL